MKYLHHLNRRLIMIIYIKIDGKTKEEILKKIDSESFEDLMGQFDKGEFDPKRAEKWALHEQLAKSVYESTKKNVPPQLQEDHNLADNRRIEEGRQMREMMTSEIVKKEEKPLQPCHDYNWLVLLSAEQLGILVFNDSEDSNTEDDLNFLEDLEKRVLEYQQQREEARER